jgi:hypothetical protein
MYTIIGTYYSFLDDCCPSWIVPIQLGQQLYLLMMGLDTPETCRG